MSNGDGRREKETEREREREREREKKRADGFLRPEEFAKDRRRHWRKEAEEQKMERVRPQRG
jgi:hypothetical protein